MSVITIAKVTQLPAAYTPNTLYLVKGNDQAIMQTYFSTMDGSAVVPGIDEAFVVNKINQLAGSGFSELQVVLTIAERDALTLSRNSLIYVLDAQGDGAGTTGECLYLYYVAQSSFHKVSTAPPAVQWSQIVGAPQSTGAQIDAAVQASHSHDNKNVLDKLSMNEQGQLVFDGTTPLNVVFVEGAW